MAGLSQTIERYPVPTLIVTAGAGLLIAYYLRGGPGRQATRDQAAVPATADTNTTPGVNFVSSSMLNDALNTHDQALRDWVANQLQGQQ